LVPSEIEFKNFDNQITTPSNAYYGFCKFQNIAVDKISILLTISVLVEMGLYKEAEAFLEENKIFMEFSTYSELKNKMRQFKIKNN